MKKVNTDEKYLGVIVNLVYGDEGRSVNLVAENREAMLEFLCHYSKLAKATGMDKEIRETAVKAVDVRMYVSRTPN